ncbi:MAG: T9SS type A sorting domain-containing protein, partial [Bacteroidales bacterium]|nr:T9SS type A sorting domain-containing protein [Bacteroidales bacterium]
STWQKIYDFGNTWQGSVNNIEIDNNSNIYLATSIYGVYYSSDGGTTWTNIGGSMFMRYNPKEGRVYSINNYHLAYINTGGGSSIGTISSNNLSIYPNPAFDYIFIKNYNSADVKIIDLNGRMYKLASNNGRVNISTLPKGMYLLTIGNNSYKFIKK